MWEIAGNNDKEPTVIVMDSQLWTPSSLKFGNHNKYYTADATRTSQKLAFFLCKLPSTALRHVLATAGSQPFMKLLKIDVNAATVVFWDTERQRPSQTTLQQLMRPISNNAHPTPAGCYYLSLCPPIYNLRS